MMRRAEMLPSGSGPFLKVAEARMGPRGMKREIHTESGSLCSGLTVSAVTTLSPEVCGRLLLQCSQHLQRSALDGGGWSV